MNQSIYTSPYIKRQHLLALKEPLNVLPYLQGTYANRGTRKDEVTRLEHEELAYVGHQLIHAIEHIHGVSTLYGLPVNIEMEMNVLHMRKAFYGNEIA